MSDRTTDHLDDHPDDHPRASTPDRTRPVYKIVDADAWREAEAAGQFTGAGIDLTDGYIHLSTGAQARETAARHYAGRSGLVLVAVDGAALDRAAGEAFRYEPSRGGAPFPHLYAALPMDCVAWVRPLPLGEDGAHAFPPEMDGREPSIRTSAHAPDRC